MVCVGCVSKQDTQFQLAQSQREVRRLERENDNLRQDLAGHQSWSCQVLTKVEAAASSAYDAAKPLVLQDAKEAAAWVSKEYHEHTKP